MDLNDRGFGSSSWLKGTSFLWYGEKDNLYFCFFWHIYNKFMFMYYRCQRKKNKYLEELLLSNSNSLYSNTFFKMILLPLLLEKMVGRHWNLGWSAWLQHWSMIIHQVHGWQWRGTYPSTAKITGCHSLLKTIFIWQRILNGEDQCSMWQSPQPESDFQNQTHTPKI